MLGHVIRAGDRDDRDPLYRVTCSDKDIAPKTTATRRVGRPRHKWHDSTMTMAWDKITTNKTHNQEYTGSARQRKIIKETALQREYLFQKTTDEKRSKTCQ